MVSLSASEEPPAKRRRKFKKPEPVPKWETTRTFSEKTRPKPSLPTIQKDGAVHRPAAVRPKFVAKATGTAQKPATFTVPPSDREKRPGSAKSIISSPATTGKRAQSASYKAKKRERQALEQYAKKIEDFEATKASIAAIASKIIANPGENIALLKQLRQMAHHHKGRSAALSILTEAQLFKDIAPAYRIRPITEKEAETKVSKEVARLRNFEETFLGGYQRFVRSCISISRWRPGGATLTAATKDMIKVRHASCKALAELIRALPHFNEANVVATAVCALVLDREDHVRKESAEALRTVLGDAHRASGPTLDVCIHIAKTLANFAAGKVRAAPEEVIVPLVSIQFGSFARLPISEKKNEPKKSKRFIKKRRRKPDKDEAVEETELEKDLREADAEATPQELYTARKSLLDSACHAYFNVIKAATSDVEGTPNANDKRTRKRKPPPALSAALKGLLRVSTFINTDVLEAILGALSPLLEKGGLPLAIRFRCLSAAYAVLGLHSRAQRADPDSFTGDARAMDSSLYTALGCLFGPDTPGKDDEYITFDAVETVLAATSFREIPSSRCAALARRLAVLATSAAPTHACTIGLLRASQLLMPPALTSQIYLQKGADDTYRFVGESGLVQEFDMNTDDPEIANAERSAAWELSCLSAHFHPSVREASHSCGSGICGSRLPSNSENIVVTAKKHSSAEGGFNPAPIEKLGSKISKRKPQSGSLLQDRVLSKSLPIIEVRKSFVNDGDEGSGDFFASRWEQASLV